MSANLVSLSSLSGKEFTAATRAWAIGEGMEVSERGALSPDVIKAAIIADPMVERPESAGSSGRVFVVTDTSGHAHKVTGTRARTLEGIAAVVGLDPDEVATVTLDGVLFDLPHRTAPVPGEVAPWLVDYATADGTRRAEYVHEAKGRLSADTVADSVGCQPHDIVRVWRDGIAYVPEISVVLSRVPGVTVE